MLFTQLRQLYSMLHAGNDAVGMLRNFPLQTIRLALEDHALRTTVLDKHLCRASTENILCTLLHCVESSMFGNVKTLLETVFRLAK